MNSPICITRSDARAGTGYRRFPRSGGMLILALAAASLASSLLMGCAGGQPEPGEAGRGDAAQAADGVPAGASADESGEGNVSFHYSNKSTDANVSIDLGSTDLYLEMTGRPAQAEAKPAAAEREEAHAAARRREPAAEDRSDPKGDKEDADGDDSPPQQRAQAGGNTAKTAKAARPQAKTQPDLTEDDPGSYEDVTSRVLTGIRKAQELFYQKRYPEALQAVRSSLDARPTAEGHALAGSIQYMQGQNGMARREWMEALRLNPDMPAVLNMLEKTRTPGGRGSPNPRPIPMRTAPRVPDEPLPEADEVPYPEVYNGSLPAAPRANHLARPTQSLPVPSVPSAAPPSPSVTPAPIPPAAVPSAVEPDSADAERDGAGTAPRATDAAAPKPAVKKPLEKKRP
jgi:hypothetical protein